MPARSARNDHIDEIRHFNRFYTKRLGVLSPNLLGSGFSLAEARLLYEIAHRDEPSAALLGRELEIDASYLSRLLQRFETRGLLRRTPSPSDARRQLLSLTESGRDALAPLEQGARDQIAAMLRPLNEGQQRRLLVAMRAIGTLLSPDETRSAARSLVLRPHRGGDIGWVISRHGALYAEEEGWNEEFEAFVADIAAKFIRKFDPQRERCWIAEIENEIVGSIFVVRRSATIAQLRMLIVDPKVRGLGIGTKLIDESIRFARQVGYRKMMLWTNAGLDAARRLYEAAGFELVREEPHRSFGHDLIGQTWTLDLRLRSAAKRTGAASKRKAASWGATPPKAR